jgi:HSP20 family protein
MYTPFDFGFGDLFSLFAPEIRVEEYIADGMYTMRAELPGVDPDKDVKVTVEDSVLRVQVERTEEMHEKVHSEFHYGKFARAVTLPAGAVEDTATAIYTDGILEVMVKVGEPREVSRRIVIGRPKARAVKAKAA